MWNNYAWKENRQTNKENIHQKEPKNPKNQLQQRQQNKHKTPHQTLRMIIKSLKYKRVMHCPLPQQGSSLAVELCHLPICP